MSFRTPPIAREESERQGRVARPAPGFLTATSSLRFCRRGLRNVALLGVIEVGDITPWAGGGAYVTVYLPFARSMRRASSMAAGEVALREVVAQWLEAAGLGASR